MQVTLDINGRKALPLRAIPYVTSWKIAPDEIVGVLVAPKTTKTNHGTEVLNRHNELFAYQMDAQGNVVQVPLSQWKQWIVTFDSLTKKLRANEREDAENENYALWRIKAVLELPDNVFVWLDDFQHWHALTQSQNSPICESEHDGDGCDQVDDTLCLTPILPPKIQNRVWRYADGFVATEPDGLHEHVVIHRHQENSQVCAADQDSNDLPPATMKQASPETQAKLLGGKDQTNIKTWDDAKLRRLLDESLLHGVTHQSLAKKHGVSRQLIGRKLADAREKFKVRNSWTGQLATANVRKVKGKY